MDRIEFEDALQAYETRFNSMEPELELTVRDPALGVEGWVVVEGIAGLGVAVAARTMLEETGRSPSSATIAVQGVGAMGAAVCRYATEYGMTVRYIADPRIGGCWRIESEFDGPLAEAIVTMDFEAARTALEEGPHVCTELDDVLVQSVDVLFPCAVPYVITADNVDAIAASAVVEGADNPCTMEARGLLEDRGVTVIPDFIANPGGAIAANVEMVSDVTDEEDARTRAKVTEAKECTDQTVAGNVRQAMALADEVGVGITRAGLLISYQRVFGES